MCTNVSSTVLRDCGACAPSAPITTKQLFRESISVGRKQLITSRVILCVEFLSFTEEKVAVKVRFLATGESFQSLSFIFRMGRKSTVYVKS